MHTRKVKSRPCGRCRICSSIFRDHKDIETLTISFDAAEIHNWSDLPEAPSTLPQLVRLLVMDTLAEFPKVLDIPSGSSVNFGGWDGLLKVDNGNTWVPNGISGWEFSCRADVGSKANADYKKRSADPLGLDISNTTFVFLTSRRWPGKSEWQQARREEGVWANVVALDADDLVGWLEQSPKGTQRFASIIGRRPFDYANLATLNEIKANTEKMLSQMSEFIAQPDAFATPTVASEDPSTSASSKDPEYQELVAQLDFCRDLLKQGLIDTARSRLEQIQIETDDIPDDLKFRIVTNLAACALGSNSIDDACRLFEQAYGMQPEMPAAMANAAVAAELQQDYERALELYHFSLKRPHSGMVDSGLLPLSSPTQQATAPVRDQTPTHADRRSLPPPSLRCSRISCPPPSDGPPRTLAQQD